MVLYSCNLNLYAFFSTWCWTYVCKQMIAGFKWFEWTYLYTVIYWCLSLRIIFVHPCLGWKTSLSQFDSFTNSLNACWQLKLRNRNIPSCHRNQYTLRSLHNILFIYFILYLFIEQRMCVLPWAWTDRQSNTAQLQ